MYGARGVMEQLGKVSPQNLASARVRMQEAFMGQAVSAKSQREMARRTGTTFATVRDLHSQGLFKNQTLIDQGAAEMGEAFWALPADKWVLKSEEGQLLDLRYWQKAMKKTVGGLEDHFGSPSYILTR
jgi:hypothetical protein